MCDLQARHMQLNNAFDLLTFEKTEKEKTIAKLTHRENVTSDLDKLNEDYDFVLQEQFNNLKLAFTNKLNALSSEFVTSNSRYKKMLAEKENELKLYKNLKDLFVQQTKLIREIVLTT